MFYNNVMEFKQFVFKNRVSGEFWICRGATTPDISKATIFSMEQANRFFRKAAHPHKWERLEVSNNELKI